MKGFLLFLACLAVLLLLVGRFVWKGLAAAIAGWTADPIHMFVAIAFSLVVGQGIFWIFGFDQFGWHLAPFKQLGLGVTVAEWIAARIPHTPTVIWTVKALEVLTDFGKVPIEGMLYIRFGFVPDGLAALVTQPLWSTIETAEKISGAIARPDIVVTSDQLRLSLGCIYGSLFRYAQSAVLWFFGATLYTWIGVPVESLLRRLFGG